MTDLDDQVRQFPRSNNRDGSKVEGWASGLRSALLLIWSHSSKSYDARNRCIGEFADVLGSGAFLTYGAVARNSQVGAKLARNLVSCSTPPAKPESSVSNPCKHRRGRAWLVIHALLSNGFKSAGRDDLSERLHGEIETLIRWKPRFAVASILHGRLRFGSCGSDLIRQLNSKGLYNVVN